MLTELIPVKLRQQYTDAALEVKDHVNEALLLLQTPRSNLTEVQTELNDALETMGIAFVHLADEKVLDKISSRLKVAGENLILLHKGDKNALFTKIEEHLCNLNRYVKAEHPTQIADQ